MIDACGSSKDRRQVGLLADRSLFRFRGFTCAHESAAPPRATRTPGRVGAGSGSRAKTGHRIDSDACWVVVIRIVPAGLFRISQARSLLAIDHVRRGRNGEAASGLARALRSEVPLVLIVSRLVRRPLIPKREAIVFLSIPGRYWPPRAQELVDEGTNFR
jgi:hypothetical protein